ncbi:hypothetical protein LGN20_25645 [Burkholderia cepacia]|uniref:hypothetical protein n=1 Tax=Burkholderia TaxID=32008 RepID=UPI00197E9823|nr:MULTISPECIES: hypothetical protein [Burkholderia]MBN3734936.1 hypothetical protein [Burkholderia sp. Tr-20390]MCA8217293.1 hypothetical protein [Burkholderia cepacia]
MNSTELAIADYQGAVKRLLQAAFDQQRVENPNAYGNCSLVLQSGGMVQVRSSAMMGGVLETVISVVDAAGESVEVARLESGVVNH